MKLKLALIFVAGAMTALAAKPQPCPRYAATVYVATSFAYALTGDSSTFEWFDGVPYVRYEDGQGGVEAYVNGGTCGGSFFFKLNGTRKLNVSFPNWQNDGTSGPPKGGSPQPTTLGVLFLRGFSFQWTGIAAGATYTTMLPGNGLAFGGALRYEPMTSDYLTDNPDFPTYPDMNQPCETSAARMTVISPTETLITPVPVTCLNPNATTYSGPLASLLMPLKGPKLANVGQFGMDYSLRIVVPGWSRF
jgi:hypothetical protein